MVPVMDMIPEVPGGPKTQHFGFIRADEVMENIVSVMKPYIRRKYMAYISNRYPLKSGNSIEIMFETGETSQDGVLIYNIYDKNNDKIYCNHYNNKTDWSFRRGQMVQNCTFKTVDYSLNNINVDDNGTIDYIAKN